MKTYVIGSMGPSAGKTSIIVGIARALEKEFGYMKPLGDRLLYRKKRQWDHDAALMTRVFGLKDNAEDFTLGFEHAKLRYMYDKPATKEKLGELHARVSKGRELVLIEASMGLACGTSVHLDPMSIASHVDAELIIVVSGREDTMLDDVRFLKKHVDASSVRFKGLVFNKIKDIGDFRETHLDYIESQGMDVLGIIPYDRELTLPTVDLVAEQLFAKVIAGEGGLSAHVKDVFVGAMGASAAQRDPNFRKGGKLIITSGDRSDMILAAIESDTAAVLMTNDLLPPANIISKAEERGVPLLSVPLDTFKAAKRIDDMDVLLTAGEAEKMALLERLVKGNLDLSGL